MEEEADAIGVANDATPEPTELTDQEPDCYYSPIPQTSSEHTEIQAWSRTKRDWMGRDHWSHKNRIRPRWLVMYGICENPDTHPKRKCAVCGARPILRFVGRGNAYGKGYCKQHLTEAWAEQAKQPVPFQECIGYE